MLRVSRERGVNLVLEENTYFRKDEKCKPNNQTTVEETRTRTRRENDLFSSENVISVKIVTG